MNDERCPTCGRDMEFDVYSETWFCEHCNRIYDEDEASSSTEWFVSSLLMWIPGINIILAMTTKDRLKRTIYVNMFMSSIFSVIAVSIVLMIVVYNFKGNFYEGIIHGKQRLTNLMIHELEVEVPEVTFVKLPEVAPIVDAEEIVFNEDMIRYMDGSYISGEDVREIIQTFDKHYLINTFTIREKYGPATYLPVGYVFGECVTEDSGTMLKYDMSKNKTYTPTTEVEDKSLIDNKKTIYYIYPTSYFKVQVIRDKNDIVLGLQFTEEVL